MARAAAASGANSLASLSVDFAGNSSETAAGVVWDSGSCWFGFPSWPGLPGHTAPLCLLLGGAYNSPGTIRTLSVALFLSWGSLTHGVVMLIAYH